MVNRNSSTDIGNLAELNACQFLEKNGLRFVEKNFIAHNPDGKACGEIDLIMRDKKYYVFVEVKSRQQDDYGDALSMVTPQKQARIIRATKYYLLRHGLWDKADCRFDVVGISPEKAEPIIWIKDAFQVQY
ncbi:MAG: YraN family protein [Gammaproteobacteria bacterium]|nr:YraN family protein [Gammaproteobacteria bacterium]